MSEITPCTQTEKSLNLLNITDNENTFNDDDDDDNYDESSNVMETNV